MPPFLFSRFRGSQLQAARSRTLTALTDPPVSKTIRQARAQLAHSGPGSIGVIKRDRSASPSDIRKSVDLGRLSSNNCFCISAIGCAAPRQFCSLSLSCIIIFLLLLHSLSTTASIQRHEAKQLLQQTVQSDIVDINATKQDL